MIFLLIFFQTAPKAFAQSQTGSPSAGDIWQQPLRECPEIPRSEEPFLWLASDNDQTLYLTTITGKLISLEIPNTRINWETDLGTGIKTRPLITEKLILVVVETVAGEESKKTYLRAISRLTGITIWQTVLNNSGKFFSILRYPHQITVFSLGDVQSFNIENGELSGAVENQPDEDQFVFFSPTQIFFLSDGRITSETQSKNVFWNNPSANKITAIARDYSGSLSVGDELGNIFQMDSRNKPAWRFRTGGEITSLLTSEENIFATSLDNFIYCLAGKNGSLRWKKRFPERIRTVQQNSTGLLLIGGRGNGGITLIRSLDGETVNRIELARDEYLISEPVLINDFLILATTNSTRLYTPLKCPAEKRAQP